ncbi:zona pellucida-binding protein 2 isoform X2 [Eleutherodactylus coqui]|uniref:zona pellucida-binding protein 2 isoform X2 n=1 Tax=Eleutherodactylus coqui TaxID=57060 RepID=UPI003462B584
MEGPCALLCVLSHLIMVFVVRVKTTELYIPPLVTKHYIYGDVNHKVNVYVKMLTDSPFLVCMDIDMAYEETIDPKFLWIGPDGNVLEGHSNVNITETGKLMLKSFDKSMSGSYSCTLFYKRIKDDVSQEKELYKGYKFAVLAYLDPDYTFQINVRYMAKPCNEKANERFVVTFLKTINQVIASLNCHLEDTYHKCHVIKAPKHSMQNQLFVAFKVDPFFGRWNKECSSKPYGCQKETSTRLEMAKKFIVEFFRMQTRVLQEEFVNVPEINYVEHSLDIIHVDSCRPGFGKNEVTHHDCPGCCVVCDPGTYSSFNNIHCEVCKDIKITDHGATEC